MGRRPNVRLSPSTILVLTEVDHALLNRITAQILGPHTKEAFTDFPLQDRDLVEGPNRSQYASFTWADLSAIAPWLDISKKIDGPGLGNE